MSIFKEQMRIAVCNMMLQLHSRVITAITGRFVAVQINDSFTMISTVTRRTISISQRQLAVGVPTMGEATYAPVDYMISPAALDDATHYMS